MKTTSNILKTATGICLVIFLLSSCNNPFTKTSKTYIENKAAKADKVSTKENMPQWRPVYAWVRNAGDGC